MAKAKKPKDDIAPEDAKEATRDDIPRDLNADTTDEMTTEHRTTEAETLSKDPVTETADTGEQLNTSTLDQEPRTQDTDMDAAETKPSDDPLMATAQDIPEEEVKAQETSETEVASDEPVAPPPAPEPRRNSFWPAVFGGVVAAMVGFIAGRGDMLDAYFPREDPVDLAPLTEQTAALTTRIEELENVEPVEPVEVVDTGELTAGLDDLSRSLDAMQGTLQEQTARLDAIEARPQPAEPAPQVDNSAEVAALQSAITALESRLAEQDAQASAEAARLLAQAALTRVVTAVENGETFAPALGALEEVAPVEVPDALRSAAAEGVPSMATLRENFPDAARAALAAARAEVPESDVAGIGGFLRRQLSARSVTPREGSDPDAVLSRAEAALRGNDLETALTELGGLPDAARSAMQGWLDGAQARKDASDAAKALSDSLTVN